MLSIFFSIFEKKEILKSFKKIAQKNRPCCLPQVHFFLAENKKEKKKEKKNKKKTKTKKKQKQKMTRSTLLSDRKHKRKKRRRGEERENKFFPRKKHCTKYGTMHTTFV